MNFAANNGAPQDTLHENLTIHQFIAKHGMRFECKQVEMRPDGMMEHFDGSIGGTAQPMQHFRCKISMAHLHNYHGKTQYPIKSFSLYFSQGSAHTANPTLADVLTCLASEASGYEDAKSWKAPYEKPETDAFELWASEYGYSPDSRKAERIFRTIKRQAEQLKRTLGQEAYEELLYNTERL